MSEVLVEEVVLDQLLAHISTISLGIRVNVILLTFYVLHIYGMTSLILQLNFLSSLYKLHVLRQRSPVKSLAYEKSCN